METNESYRKPFKLEDISKKDTFSVPEGYFENLPTIIQSKAIESTKKKIAFTQVGVLKLAIPSLLLLIIAGYFGYKYQNNPSQLDSKIELMLADVSTEEMVDFLDQTELSSDDLLEMVSFDGERIDDFSYDLENVSDEELELLINDFEIVDIENI
jgi:hypothetical protein